ncbi:MAG: ATP-binding protein [Sulfurospirillaceae bacterium]|nr:ATP-binding protein [Sulfurospirillaceae bacterium]
MLQELFENFKASGGSAGQIVRDTGLNAAYVSKALSGWGDYNLSANSKAKVEETIINYLESKVEIKESLNTLKGEFKKGKYSEICLNAGILEFTNTENIIATLIKSVKQKALTKICGKSGTGKTTAIEAFIKKYPQASMVTSYDGMNQVEFLEELSFAIGMKNVPKGKKSLMRCIKRELMSNKKIVIVDEANFLNESSLEQIRHIHDVCKIPIILVGTERLELIIARSHPQVENRIRASLPIEPFNAIEVGMMTQSFGIELDDKQVIKLWKRCQNLREVKYWCEDFVEVYEGDAQNFEEAMR